MAYGQIYARPVPSIERMNRMSKIQEAIREPEEAPYVGGLGAIKAAKLLAEAQQSTMYTPRSLAEAASKARLPVPERQGQQVPQRQVQQVPQQRQAITNEDERILTAQAGGRAAIPQQIENVASRGRHGDTMLMHVNPDELKGLSSLLGPTTINPDTGLPEAFAWWLPLIGAAIGGISTGSWKGAALGGLAGLGGAGFLGATGLGGTAAGTLGSTWGPFSGLFGGATGLGGGAAGAGLGVGTGGATAAGLGLAGAPAGGVAAQQAALINAGVLGTAGGAPMATVGPGTLGLTGPVAGSQALSSVPHTMGMGWGPGVTPTTPIPITPITTPTYGQQMGTWPTNLAARGVTSRGAPMKQGVDTWAKAAEFSQGAGETPSDLLTSGAFDTGGEGAMGTEPAIPWWKKGVEWAKEHPLATGAGAVGISSLLAQPPEQQVADVPIRTVSELEDLSIPPSRVVSEDYPETEEDIYESITTGPAPRYFAKEGGLVSLQMGGSTIPMPGGAAHYQRYGTFGGPAPGSPGYYQKYGTFGTAMYTPSSTPQALDPDVNPHLQDPMYGLVGAGGAGGPAAPAVTPPFEFPEVTPFQSSLPSFNLEDRLARITGQPQAALPSTLPQQTTLPPSTVATTPAIENLLSRFQQTAQIDPIAGLVASQVGVKQGGLPELAHGGIFEGHVQGRGDGMADQIPFRVMPQTPEDIPKAPDMAVLSTDEYVFPADAVSMIGNGSSNAGAKILDNAVKQVRRASIGTPKQITEIDGGKVLRGALTT